MDTPKMDDYRRNLRAGFRAALREQNAAHARILDLEKRLEKNGQRMEAVRRILWAAPCGNASENAPGWNYPACSDKCGGCDCWIGEAIEALDPIRKKEREEKEGKAK